LNAGNRFNNEESTKIEKNQDRPLWGNPKVSKEQTVRKKKTRKRQTGRGREKGLLVTGIRGLA